MIHDSSEGRDVLQVGAMTALVRLLRTARFSQRSPSETPRNKRPYQELQLQGWHSPLAPAKTTPEGCQHQRWSSRGNEQTPSSVRNTVRPIQRISRERTSPENNNRGSAGRGDCANSPLLYTKKQLVRSHVTWPKGLSSPKGSRGKFSSREANS